MRRPFRAFAAYQALRSLPARWSRRAARPALACRPGQAIVEAALTTLLSVITVIVVLQLSLVVAQVMGAAHVARLTSRWLAVRVDAIDSAVVAQANLFATDLPGVGSGGIASVTVSPSCPALTGPAPGKCASRASGDAVTVTLTANLSRVMFLPTTYGIAPLEFRLPATMPPIAYTVLLE
jgi:hypothetical protein